MKDIENREDIELLVDRFYKQVLQDPVIGHFFTKVMVLDWDLHIPLMCDFWETTLLGKAKYKGNPMMKHLTLHKMAPMQREHFDQWISLWENAVNQNFRGERALEAIKRAQQISGIMQYKIAQTDA